MMYRFKDQSMMHRFKGQSKKKEQLTELEIKYQRAISLANQRRYADAENIYRWTWQNRQRILGPDHPDTLYSQSGLAWVLSALNRINEAETLARQTWYIRQRVLGQDHRDTLYSQGLLAYVLSQLGRHHEAETLHRQTWLTRQHTLGQENQDALESQRQLAWVLLKLQRYKEAETLCRQTWHARKRIFGPDLPETLNSKAQLAWTLCHLQRNTEAETLFRETWTSREVTLGKCYIDTLEVLQHLSYCIFGLEKYALALELGRDLLGKITYLPPHEREVIEKVAKLNQAQFLFENNYDYEAEEILQDVVQEGFTNDPEREGVAKFCLAIISSSTRLLDLPLPSIKTHLMPSVVFTPGKRLQEMTKILSSNNEESNIAEPGNSSLQETSSFVTCEESQRFIEGLVSRAEVSVNNINDEIMTIADDDTVPTTLELDIYYDKPKETCFMTVQARLDTQAGANFISSALVRLLGYRVRTYQDGEVFTAAGTIQPIGQVSPLFQWEKSSIMERDFVVIKDLPVDIILGIQFIREFQVLRMGNVLFLMALSPLREDEKKQVKARAIENQKRRAAEEKAESDRNRAKRLKEAQARAARTRDHTPDTTNVPPENIATVGTQPNI